MSVHLRYHNTIYFWPSLSSALIFSMCRKETSKQCESCQEGIFYPARNEFVGIVVG
jgi:hypothetical protein